MTSVPGSRYCPDLRTLAPSFNRISTWLIFRELPSGDESGTSAVLSCGDIRYRGYVGGKCGAAALYGHTTAVQITFWGLGCDWSVHNVGLYTCKCGGSSRCWNQDHTDQGQHASDCSDWMCRALFRCDRRSATTLTDITTGKKRRVNWFVKSDDVPCTGLHIKIRNHSKFSQESPQEHQNYNYEIDITASCRRPGTTHLCLPCYDIRGSCQ